MISRARKLQTKLQSIRRQIHRNPELSFAEFETADLIKSELQSNNISFTPGVAGTGVVGVIGSSGPIIALRADMDALPIQEESTAPYASQNSGVMHACGHDGHVACLLGAAELLAEMEIPGRVRLIFQPSEEALDREGKSGAMRMASEGVLDEVSAIIALHMDAASPPGKIKIGEGPVLASMDEFQLTVQGAGCHGAYPHKGLDPIFISTQVLNLIYGIISRHIDPMEKAVISIGQVSGGSACNIIPSQVVINGTIRSFSKQVRAKILEEVRRAADVILALGGDYQLLFFGGYPVTSNDPSVVSIVRESVRELLGEESLSIMEPQMGSEDFGVYLEKVRGAFFYLGAAVPDAARRAHHNPRFDIDDEILYVGSAILAETALKWLRRTSGKEDL